MMIVSVSWGMGKKICVVVLVMTRLSCWASSLARVYMLVTHVTDEKMDAIREISGLINGSSRITDVLFSEQPGEWFTVSV